eukprot:TRINITY_DN10614_c0_g1_i6.p1 TRINITY_DN10614_c0_g1~~TRINITY_DN10614_c0_g1_i6.p1  ORF type:complete len:367 (+),score=111.58 TRINITY_DN10614_c0_g1_i6:174-1274(+)
MAEFFCNQSSKCFTYLLPFLESNLIDSCDSFLFGYTLGKNGMQNLSLIAATMEKILELKKSYDVTQKALNAIYCLILEQNWTIAEELLKEILKCKKQMEELAVERKPLETGVVGAENIKVNGAIDWLKKLREDCKRRQKIELESVQRWEELNRRRKKEEEETIRFINEMQEQEEAEREIRRQRVEEGNPTNCDICLEKIEAKDLLPLDRCGHLFHPACLRQYFETEIGFRRLPLVCPLCRIEVSVMDIKDFLTADGQAKWEEYTFKKAVESNPDNFSFCPTPDCSYVFVWDPSDTSDFTCPTCAKRYCLNCRCAFHTDQSCKEYQISSKFTEEDKQFVNFVKGMKFKQCPKCRFWVEKNQVPSRSP